ETLLELRRGAELMAGEEAPQALERCARLAAPGVLEEAEELGRGAAHETVEMLGGMTAEHAHEVGLIVLVAPDVAEQVPVAAVHQLVGHAGMPRQQRAEIGEEGLERRRAGIALDGFVDSQDGLEETEIAERVRPALHELRRLLGPAALIGGVRNLAGQLVEI